ncbi:MAG: hypothetical protein WC632_01815 [Candidatus Margulisiibacteriota bacterium]
MVKQRLLNIIRKPGFRSITISPYSLHRLGYSFALTIFDGNGMVKDQLKEPYETARQLFREKVEKIVIKRGAKPEDIAALFFRLDDARLSLHDFSSKIEVVYRPQPSEQNQAAVPQTAKPVVKQTELLPPVPQTIIPRPANVTPSFSYNYDSLVYACESAAQTFHPDRHYVFSQFIENGKVLSGWIDYLTQGNGDNLRIVYRIKPSQEQLAMLIKALRETAQMIRQHPAMKAAAQPAKAPTPEVKLVGAPLTPADLLAAGGKLKKQANQNPNNIPKAEIEAWIATAKEKLSAYQGELGPGPRHNWTEALITQRVTFADLVEAMHKLETKLGGTPTEINLPRYVDPAARNAWDRQQRVETRQPPQLAARPAPRQAVASRDSIAPLSPPRSGRAWGKQFFVAGIYGRFVDVLGEKSDHFLPNQLSHTTLDYGYFVDTGITLLGHERPLKVYCTQTFLEVTADFLLKAIADGQIFHRKDSLSLNPEEELIFATEHFGSYYPQGAMSAKTLVRGFDFPFRLTVEEFLKEWTAKDLIRAMAQRPLRAVGIEKEAETVPTQPVKPEQPANCRTDDQLVSVIGEIRLISWELEEGEISPARAMARLSAYNDPSLLIWLDHLAQDRDLREYSSLYGWGSNLSDAINIMKHWFPTSDTAAQKAQPAKPPRPLSCDRLYYLRETCAKIFEIGHSSAPALGELNSPERELHINACLVGEDIRPWLTHLNSGGTAALTAAYPDEYQYMLRNALNPDYYPSLIRKALDILNQVYEKI